MSNLSFRRADLVCELEVLLGAGVSAENVAHRLGIRPATLSRRMYRARRPDLARPFERVANRERRSG